MDAAWQKRISPWRVLTWTGVVVMAVFVIVNSTRPTLSEVLGSALPPLVIVPIIDLVSQRRRGRTCAWSVGHALLVLVSAALALASFYALMATFGRPRNPDPFVDTFDPLARILVIFIFMIFVWAEVARYFDLGPSARKRDL